MRLTFLYAEEPEYKSADVSDGTVAKSARSLGSEVIDPMGSVTRSFDTSWAKASQDGPPADEGDASAVIQKPIGNSLELTVDEWPLFSQLSFLGFDVIDYDIGRPSVDQIFDYTMLPGALNSPKSGLSAVEEKLILANELYLASPNNVQIELSTSHMSQFLHMLNATIDAGRAINYEYGSNDSDFAHSFPFDDTEQQQLSQSVKLVLAAAVGPQINVQAVSAPIVVARP